MKKLFLMFSLAVLSTALFAQKQGDVVISGSLGFTSLSSKEKTGNTSQSNKGDRSFSFIPSFNYFVADNWSVGLGIGYQFDKTPNGNVDDDKELFDKLGLFVLQPMVKYYVALGGKFYYTPRFYLGFGFGKYKEEEGRNTMQETKVSTFNVGLEVLSFEFKPVERVGMTFSAGALSYGSTTTKEDDFKYSDRSFGLNLNLSAAVGFNFYF